MDAATAARKVAAWSDLEDNSDNKEAIESKDSDDDQSLFERYDEASSAVNSHITSAEDELTVSSVRENDS